MLNGVICNKHCCKRLTQYHFILWKIKIFLYRVSFRRGRIFLLSSSSVYVWIYICHVYIKISNYRLKFSKNSLTNISFSIPQNKNKYIRVTIGCFSIRGGIRPHKCMKTFTIISQTNRTPPHGIISSQFALFVLQNWLSPFESPSNPCFENENTNTSFNLIKTLFQILFHQSNQGGFTSNLSAREAHRFFCYRLFVIGLWLISECCFLRWCIFFME